MATKLEETLKKLQEGAADHGATVMLEGERFRVRCEDGWSTLYEQDKTGGFKVVQRTDAQNGAVLVKDGGESTSVDAAIKDMEEGPKKRKADLEEKKHKDAEAAQAAAKKASSTQPAQPGNPHK